MPCRSRDRVVRGGDPSSRRPPSTTQALVNWSRTPVMSSRQLRSRMTRATGSAGSPTMNRSSPLGASRSDAAPVGRPLGGAHVALDLHELVAARRRRAAAPRAASGRSGSRGRAAACRRARTGAARSTGPPVSFARPVRRATARSRCDGGNRRPRSSAGRTRPAHRPPTRRAAVSSDLAQEVACLEAGGRHAPNLLRPTAPVTLGLAPSPLTRSREAEKETDNEAPAARDPTRALNHTRVESEKVLLDDEAISRTLSADRTRDHRAQRRRDRRTRRHPHARRPARAAPPPPDRGVQRPGGQRSGPSTSPSTATTCTSAAGRRRCTRSRSSATRSSSSRSRA